MDAELLKRIDEAAGARVLVFGSPPPEGRDVDLLVRPPERRMVEEVLRGARDPAVAVDLVDAAEWGLGTAETRALFYEAEPLAGYGCLVVPAAHHVLLIAARRLARGGALTQRQRVRVLAAVERDPDAWARARSRAGYWSARSGLRLLRAELDARGAAARALRALARGEQAAGEVFSGGARATLARRAARRRPAVVSFSGLDGSGKSLQATTLEAALRERGIRAAVVWPPGSNLLFRMPDAIKNPLKRALGAGRAADGEPAVAQARADEDDAPTLEPLPDQPAPVRHVLAAVVAIVQGLALRRSVPKGVDVVIFDRHELDAIVYVRHRWGAGRPLRAQCALVRTLAPRATAAFLLDVPPETAYGRKRDYPLEVLHERVAIYREHAAPLGVRRLDGERAPADLSAEIERIVLAALA